MLVRELIDRLENSGLLDHEIIEALRQQLEESGARVTPEAVAKLLVDNGHLTRFQATKLIGELRDGDADGDGDEGPEADSSEADLGLAEEVAEAEVVADNTTAIIVDDDDEEEVVEAIAADDDEIAEAVPVAESVVEAQPVEAEPVDDSSNLADMAPHPVVPVGKKKSSGPDANKWDSFWIYGVAGIIVFLVGIGVTLYFVLNRQSAEDYIAKANEAYENASYPAAREVYTDFTEQYPADPNVSKARVRIGISTIVIAKASSPDPSVGLEKALEVLPTIENEEAFDQDRDDVSGVLVDIGSALAERADNQEAADDKQSTLGQLDQWFELLENPMYMTSQAKQSFGPRIKTIEETRARVVRDIARDRDLVAAISDMKEALASQQTKQAFDIRSEVVRNYPRLNDHPELQDLVLQASQIQKDLVASADSLPNVLEDAIQTEAFQSVLLANRRGRSIPELAGSVIYLRARGAVLSVAADTGEVLWRRFVGYENDNPPVALGDTSQDGVLLSDGQRGELQRIANNEIVWRSVIGETFSVPVIDGNTIYVTTDSGNVYALDAVTGDAKWGRTLPQSIPVGPGSRRNGRVIYVPGEHSNLYALSSTNGECVQSFYLGHDIGTLDVPPVELLGHVFVFENRRSDYCMVRILKVDEESGEVSVAQRDIRLTGKVVTPPFIQGRRLIVLTDLGQIVVLDVEPTAEQEKVSIAADQVATYEAPTNAEMAVGRSEVFVTGTQVDRYQLQINTGRVVRDWSKHEADVFLGKPLLIEGTLIHVRQRHDTQGVRIVAANPETGDWIWRNDIGVPVSMLAADPATRSVYAVSSQASLYQLTAGDMSMDVTKQPSEFYEGVSQDFGDPITLGDGRQVMLNRATAEQLALFDPSRDTEKLRVITLLVPPGTQAPAGSLYMAGGLLLPLNNGRIMLMNIETGTTLGSSFQPPTRPGQTVAWTTPVANPSDPEQLLICDDSPTLFRLRVGEQIRELGKTQIAQKLVGPAAASGGNWMAAAAGSAGDLLVIYSATTLDEMGRKMMGSRIAFGPVSVGDMLLLQTADGKLHRVNGDAEIQWSTELPGGLPVAAPVLQDGSLFVTGEDGWVCTLDPASGELTGRVDIGQPISGNPLITPNNMLVPGSEGLIFVTTRPGG